MEKNVHASLDSQIIEDARKIPVQIITTHTFTNYPIPEIDVECC